MVTALPSEAWQRRQVNFAPTNSDRLRPRATRGWLLPFRDSTFGERGGANRRRHGLQLPGNLKAWHNIQAEVCLDI
jgi:hypothetical protein